MTPEEIEKKSFEIIDEELSSRGISLDEELSPIIKRAIHTTADFDYAGSLKFSEGAIPKIKGLIKKGAVIVTDTNMALTGINKKAAESFGVRVRCFMADEDVAVDAGKRGETRAALCAEKAFRLNDEVIYVVGNAPTALMRIHELNRENKSFPAFIVGVPVGFVNVVCAKELIMKSDIPYIINEGRKGGSTVAAAIINALLYELEKEKI